MKRKSIPLIGNFGEVDRTTIEGQTAEIFRTSTSHMERDMRIERLLSRIEIFMQKKLQEGTRGPERR